MIHQLVFCVSSSKAMHHTKYLLSGTSLHHDYLNITYPFLIIIKGKSVYHNSSLSTIYSLIQSFLLSDQQYEVIDVISVNDVKSKMRDLEAKSSRKHLIQRRSANLWHELSCCLFTFCFTTNWPLHLFCTLTLIQYPCTINIQPLG